MIDLYSHNKNMSQEFLFVYVVFRGYYSRH